MIYTRLKQRPNVHTLSLIQVATRFFNTVNIDSTIQIDELRWSHKNKQEYILSAFKGLHESSVISLISVLGCLLTMGETAKEYFEPWSKTPSFFNPDTLTTDLCVDGWNRFNAIYEFLHDKVKLPVGGYELSSGEVVNITNKTNIYSKLPEPLRKEIEGVSMTVLQYMNITRDSHAELFDNINKSVSPNAQEIRNHVQSKTNTEIRKMSQKYKTVLTPVTKTATRKAIDDYINGLLVVYSLNKRPTSKLKDTVVEDTVHNDTMIVRFKTHLNKFIKIMGDENIGELCKNGFFDLYCIYTDYVREGRHTIPTSLQSVFARDYMTFYRTLIVDNTLIKYKKTNTDSLRDYKGLLRLCGANENLTRVKYLKSMFDFDNYFVDVDGKRSYTKEEIKWALYRQDFMVKDEDGNPIKVSLVEFINGELHGDHKLAHAEGGLTVESNLEVTSKKYNLKKGKKIIS